MKLACLSAKNASSFLVYLPCLNAHLVCLNRFLSVKALVDAFNKEKGLLRPVKLGERSLQPLVSLYHCESLPGSQTQETILGLPLLPATARTDMRGRNSAHFCQCIIVDSCHIATLSNTHHLLHFYYTIFCIHNKQIIRKGF